MPPQPLKHARPCHAHVPGCMDSSAATSLGDWPSTRQNAVQVFSWQLVLIRAQARDKSRSQVVETMGPGLLRVGPIRSQGSALAEAVCCGRIHLLQFDAFARASGCIDRCQLAQFLRRTLPSISGHFRGKCASNFGICGHLTQLQAVICHLLIRRIPVSPAHTA